MSTDVALGTIEDIARQAGEIALRYFGKIEAHHQSTKEDGTLLTVVDTEVNDFLCQKLTAEFPQYGILSEEKAEAPSGDSHWILDPIDATANFAAGNPYFSISIGLVVGGTPEIGIVYAPAEKKLYSAKRGEGAFLNGNGINVSDCRSLSGARILLDEGRREQTMRIHGSIAERLAALGARVESRQCASLEICAVASGEYDAQIHRGLKVWDIAAGIVIADEAGASVSHLNGEAKDMFAAGIVVATPAIHERIVAITGEIINAEYNT